LALKIGDMAPDFELPAVTGEKRHTVKLMDYRGRHVLVSFHIQYSTATRTPILQPIPSARDKDAPLNTQFQYRNTH